jgi:uncharacterized membrane protein YfcA
MHFVTLLIVCPLVFLGGFVDSIAGGGGLISLPAYVMTGLPIHICIGTNKMSSAMGTSVSTFQFARSGYIKFKLAMIAAVTAVASASLGAHLALQLSDRYFRMVLIIILPVTAGYLLWRKNALSAGQTAQQRLTSWQIVLAIGIAIVLGTYDGFYGPGAGTFMLLGLTGIAKLPLPLAAGTAKVINLTTNLTGLTVFLLSGSVMIQLGLIGGLFGIAGNFLGARYFKHGGAQIARPLILIVLVIFFLKLAYDFWSL